MKHILSFVVCCVLLATSENAFSADVDEQIATVINVNGFLCARVVSVRPLGEKDVYAVRCIEYRDGSGVVDYIMNAATGSVYKKN